MPAVIDHETRSWTIPEDLQGRAIKLAFLKLSAKEIYGLLFPKQPPVTQGTFTTALKLLIAGAEGEVRAIFREARLPYSPPGSALSRASDDLNQGQDQELDPSLAPDTYDLISDTDRGSNPSLDCAQNLDSHRHPIKASNQSPLPLVFGLGPQIEEEPLPGGIEAALQTFVKIRRSLEDAIEHCEEDPLPELPGKDARAVRAGALATLANAYTASVLAETRIAEARLNRTIKRHTLRLDLIDDMEEGEAEPLGSVELGSNHRRPFPRPPIGSSLSSGDGNERITGRDVLVRGRLGSGVKPDKSKDGNLFVLRLPPSKTSSQPPMMRQPKAPDASTASTASTAGTASTASTASTAKSATNGAASNQDARSNTTESINPSELLREQSELFDDEESPF